MIKTDFLIIGTGIAGLAAALELAKSGREVLLITKKDIDYSNTVYAQGGVAASALGDSPELTASLANSHFDDTIKAGGDICRKEIVTQFVSEAYAKAVEPLIEWGVPFTTIEKTKKFSLHQEGGHEFPRIYHVYDFTGKSIIRALSDKIYEHENIQVLENTTAIDLINENKTCNGVYAYNSKNNEIQFILARVTILATGGAAGIYNNTTNATIATGDGIAIAYRSNVAVSNMEFIQFHPTTFFHSQTNQVVDRRFLISEALRGENIGGRLTLSSDSTIDFINRFKYHSEGSSATRDVVSRAIYSEMRRNGISHVYLNITTGITGLDSSALAERFPTIYAYCKNQGIDIAKNAIPVVPSAHYTCGGIHVDENGQTTLPNLYAIGECACTGIHGANRLASNSLSEAVWLSKKMSAHALSNDRCIPYKYYRDLKLTSSSQNHLNPLSLRSSVSDTMWNSAGISRVGSDLRSAKKYLLETKSAVDSQFKNNTIVLDLIELRNIVDCANMIVSSALWRAESRGAHFRTDFPNQDKNFEKETSIAQMVT